MPWGVHPYRLPDGRVVILKPGLNILPNGTPMIVDPMSPERRQAEAARLRRLSKAERRIAWAGYDFLASRTPKDGTSPTPSGSSDAPTTADANTPSRTTAW